MRWHIYIEGVHKFTCESRGEMQDRMQHLDWWAINEVRVISETKEIETNGAQTTR